MTKDSPQRILFLCTGNFYRSRHAEAWFNHLATGRGLHWLAESRGFRPHIESRPISPHSSDRLREMGVPLSLTRARPAKLSQDSLASAALVIALYRREHRPMMEETFPAWAERVRYWDVPDIDETPSEQALPQIEAGVDAIVTALASGHALGTSKDVLVEF